MEPLATYADLQQRLGRTLTGSEMIRAELLLRDASAAVRAYTGQQFTAATSTVKLRPRNGTVRLPQRPVTDVTSVEYDGNDASFTWDTGDVVIIDALGASVPFDIEPIRNRSIVLDVTYEHGYDEIPDDIVAVVCQIAGRALGRAVEDSGVQQESIGGYSYSVGVAAAAGGVGMLNDEKAVLDRYKVPIGSARFG